MANHARKYDGRTSDLCFRWITETYGEKWETWRALAEKWMATRHSAIELNRRSLTAFIERYLVGCAGYAAEIPLFFKGYKGHLCSSEEFVEILAATINDKTALSEYPNHTRAFVDWVISEHYSELDDLGNKVPLFPNPLSKVRRQNTRTESVRNPLPYRYIKELRMILCPNPETGSFKDWTWAHRQTNADWFEEDAEKIDPMDPDCVFRERQIIHHGKTKTICELWSPVRAMAIFVKLHLPLRTYQVRMLDSGEADTWRYESDVWALNSKHRFAKGSENRPFKKGVFNRYIDTILGDVSTGLYVNTNKTADQNREEAERGYSIPWQHEVLLRWLEKLRNWQEKYNPIKEPVDCTELQRKHTDGLKSQTYLESMGDVCFLFRHASAKCEDKAKPIGSSTLANIWYLLLDCLQKRVASTGDAVGNHQLRFVEEYLDNRSASEKFRTLFPLHSLRVSLITCYAIDGGVPLPVISKLLAGHSRLIMTIYYTKITPSVMACQMKKSEELIEENEVEGLRNFLSDARLRQIRCKTVYNDEASIEAVIANRNPVGWEQRDKGICLVGGNTVKSDEVSRLGGCWNGGELITGKGTASPIYSSVPNGPENCPRCRWFITDGRYLPALNAHHNYVSYRATEAANLAVEIEAEVDELQDKKYFAQEHGVPFTKHTELQRLERRYEKQQVEANEYAKDLIAVFGLIVRIIHIENSRSEEDSTDKLIAVGTSDDVSVAIKYMETNSELLQLSLLCDDAEFYPDLADDVRKTPVIHKRCQHLNRILMKKGYMPHFLQMDDKQQLIAANAMMRQMAKQAQPMDKFEGYRQVATYLDADDYLMDNGLLQTGISALAQHTNEPVLKLNQIIASTARLELERAD